MDADLRFRRSINLAYLKLPSIELQPLKSKRFGSVLPVLERYFEPLQRNAENAHPYIIPYYFYTL